MPRFSLRGLLFVVTAIAVVLAFLRSAYIHLTHVEKGQDVARVAWLPDGATNVSYYKSYSFTSYEFDISEAEFRKWAWWDIEPISTPICILRYNYFTEKLPDLSPNPTAAELLAFAEAEHALHACINEGLGYVHQQSNGGGIWVAYDRKQGRAFFHSAPR